MKKLIQMIHYYFIIRFAPFIGIAIGVYIFGKISMAHFNPAGSLGFLITKHITTIQLLYYLIAEMTGALLGSLFVKFLIGSNALACGSISQLHSLEHQQRHLF
jgi:glycerol uptake facilitator-like aquaporin